MFQKRIENIETVVMKWMDRISEIKAYTLFFYLGLFAFLPLLLLSWFIHPSCDDFGYSYESLIDSFINVQVNRYFDWSGRYFSNGILSVDPLVYGSFTIYKLIPIVLFFLFLISFYHFFGTLFEGISSKAKGALTGLVFFLYIYQIPDVCQAFFWLPGSATYLLANILFVFLVSAILKYYKTKKVVYFIISFCLIFAIVGCNEVIALIMVLLFLSVLSGQYFFNKKADRTLIILFIVTLIFTGISFLAPGNAVRETYIETKHQFFYSVKGTLVYSIYYVVKWLPIILLCTLFLIEYFDKIVKRIKFKILFIHPLIAFFGMFLIVCSGIFAGYWSMNAPPPGRAINTIYFFFIFAAFYFLLSLFDYLKRTKNYSFIMPDYFRKSLLFVIILYAVSNTGILISYSDLLSGKAYKFDKEMKGRHDFITNSKDKNCKLQPLENAPLSIYSLSMEITSDKKNWKNESMSVYYGKESIVIESNLTSGKSQ